MALSFRCAVRNGLRRFQIADPSNDPARIRRIAAMARREGIEEVVVGLTYSISPVHTHEYYAQRAAALADCADIDRFYLKDPGGLLTPDAVRELAPHFLGGRRRPRRRAAQPLHDRAGASGLRRGRARRVPGRAHGGRPAFARDLTARGLQHGHEPRGGRVRTHLDLEAQAQVSDYFDRLADREGAAGRDAAGVRRRLLPPPASWRDGDDDSADAGGDPASRALRRSARGGHARARGDGLPDHRHARSRSSSPARRRAT